MFEKRHRITLLFNANKAYDRQVVEGVGEYLQASQSEWDIFIEEDFRTRTDNIKDWLGDGVIADFDDAVIQQLLVDVDVPIVGVGGSGAERVSPSERERRAPLRLLWPARFQRQGLGGGT